MYTDDKYWKKYDGLQAAKHELLVKYLRGWFPILSKFNGRILYIDCHAGRGRHKTGHKGSPLLAINTLLEHKSKNEILKDNEIVFIFFEIDEQNCKYLQNEIKKLGRLPEQVKIKLINADFESKLNRIFDELDKEKMTLAPSFAFIDPYGFTLSMQLMNRILSYPKSELLINFMFRYVDMAIHNEPQKENLNKLFGTNEWEEFREIKDKEKREKSIINLFANQLKATYVKYFRMFGSNNALKYVLIHATNHCKGCELMINSMWAISPDGSLAASERDNPDQLTFLNYEPNLTSLRESVYEEFKGKEMPIKEIYDWLFRTQIYKKAHLHQVLRELRDTKNKNGIPFVEFSGYSGRFAFSKNPIVKFN